VPRVVLIDTFGDEKFEALENAELLKGNIDAVRLDTPSSRRGDMLEIAREVRWELGHPRLRQDKDFYLRGH
jgi:nicotinate phosphoribosyltransferase